MAKSDTSTKRPTSKDGFCGNREAAPQLMIDRERRNKSGPLAASVRVKFMGLRPSMCRWPIGDPKHTETFRFCGSACSSGANYCKADNAKAHAPNPQRRHVRLNFRYNPRLESRDNSGSVASAIWTTKKRREADPQPGSR